MFQFLIILIGLKENLACNFVTCSMSHSPELVVQSGGNISLPRAEEVVCDIPSLEKTYQRSDYEKLRSQTSVTYRKGFLFLKNVTYVYTGMYQCSSFFSANMGPDCSVWSSPILSFDRSNTCSSQTVQDRAMTYLYVKDENVLSLLNPKPFSADIVISQNTFATILIPCRPTSRDVQVDLSIGTSIDLSDQKKINWNSTLKSDYKYNSQQGFQTRDIKMPGVRIFSCNFSRGGKYERLTSRLIILPQHPSIPPPSVTHFRNYYIAGESLNVECTVKTEKNVTMEWLTPQQHSDKRIRTFQDSLPSGKTSLFLLNKVHATDSGIYYCKVNSTDTDFNIGKVEIKVYKPGENFLNLIDDRISIEKWSSENGVNVQFSVKYFGFPDPGAYWTRGNKLLYSLTTDWYKTDTEFVLDIKNISHSDFGTYTLVASNDFTEKRLNFTFDLTGKPETKLEIVDFNNDTIKCTSAGYPKPDIHWYFQQCTDYNNLCIIDDKFEEIKLLVDETDREENGIQVTSFLKINSSMLGLLTCFSNNSLGSHESRQVVADLKNETFEIFGPNVSHFTNEGKKFDVRKEDNTTLVCVVPVKMHILSIKWFHKNIDVVTMKTRRPDQFKIYQNNTFYTNTSIVTIEDMAEREGGTYKCEIFNEVIGLVSKFVELVVSDKDFAPIITSVGDEVSLHDDATLECNVTGFPTPIIKWTKENIVLQPSERVRFENYNQTIKFTNVTSEDEGIYLCMATNRMGDVFQEISLTFKGEFSKYYWGIIVGLASVLFILSIFVALKIYNERELKQQLNWFGLDKFDEGAVENINSKLTFLDQANMLPYNKKWEVPVENLKFGPQLGCGAFGVVLKAQLKNDNNDDTITVAVKKVNASSGFEGLKALASELKIMIHLGQHVNIVNLIGARTKNIVKKELYIIVEYCQYGNLQLFLLKHKENFVNQINLTTGRFDSSFADIRIKRNSLLTCLDTDYIDELKNVSILPITKNHMESSSTMDISNLDIMNQTVTSKNNYYKNSKAKELTFIFTKDLIVWAFQVANGMEYLSSRKILHGDLAARNILLADENVVKICDFGLAKNMHYDNIYKRKDTGPLPIKWLAIESIFHKIFSTQSDVWSFGVVLWELFSLAMTPYPSMAVDKAFVDQLKDGYRMECPEYAPKEIYEIMLECWSKDPLMRPSFTELSERLGTMLEESLKNYYLEMNDFYIEMNNRKGFNEDYLSMMKSPNFENISIPRHSYIDSAVVPSNEDNLDNYLNMTSKKS